MKSRDVSRIGSVLDAPAMGSMDAELEAGGMERTAELKAKQEALMHDADLQQYAIQGGDAEWEQALSTVTPGGKLASVSVPSSSGKKKHGAKREANEAKRAANSKVGGSGGGAKKQKKSHK